jgi:hypothetical protein
LAAPGEGPARALEGIPETDLESVLASLSRDPDRTARGRLLDEADGLLAGDRAARRRALACYRALRSDLDPARPSDAARILWVFENDARRDGAVGEMATLAAAAPDPDLRLTAEVVLGQAAADAGRPEEAADRFRSLLDRHRGTGHRVERLACLGLAKVYAQQRRGFEALVLARMAGNLARKAGNTWDLCVARSRACLALQVIDDGERLARAVDELERSLDELPAERARPLRAMVHGLRVEAALEIEDFEGARKGLEALRTLDGTEGIPVDPRLPLYLEAEVELRTGRPREALALVERVRAEPAKSAASELPLTMLEARCRLESGDEAEARRVLLGILDVLDGEPDPDPLGTGQRIRWATEVGRLLQERCAAPEDARRAFDVAAGWVVRRIVELDRTMGQIPELSGVGPEELKALTDFRNRYVREQGEILDRVAALFGGDAPPPGLIQGEGDADAEPGFFLACAWCRRVRNSAGRWLPIGEFLPDDRHLRISHGICIDCHRRWLDRVAKG